MRDGPKPLSMYLSYAAVKQLQQNSGQEVSDFSQDQLKKFVAGVQKYQSCEYREFDPDREVVWSSGTVSVQGALGAVYDEKNPVVLLVPSLVNGSSIFDLMPEHSFLRYLQEDGVNSYLFDWGEVCEDVAQDSVDVLVLERLVAAIQHLREATDQPVYIVGYCLGGTFLAAAAAHAMECIAGLVFIAAPWDFDGDVDPLSRRVRFWANKSSSMLREQDVMAGGAVHGLLASLNPDIIVRKFMAFCDVVVGSPEEELFVLVEDWLNEHVDIPMSVARQCIENFFVGNRAVAGQWVVGGKEVLPSQFSVPCLVVASERDKLIGLPSARALYEQIDGAELLVPDCGHIGMMAGRNAQGEVWSKIAAWVCRNHQNDS